MARSAVLVALLLVAENVDATGHEHNATHHFTNSYRHVDRRAYPLNRAGHNRSAPTSTCNEACRQAAKRTLMHELMEKKVVAYNQCAAAGECPMNKAFASGVKCVDGMAGDYPCSGIDLLSFVPIAELGAVHDASDSWGWTDPDSGDEIAIIGMMDGTAFVQITQPTEPVVLGFLPQTGTNNVIWADMKVYNDHCFIVRESKNHGMQVLDLTKLRPFYNTPSSHIRILKQDAFYSEVTSTHNIAINEETAFAYLVGTKTCSGGLHVVDIKSPTNPTFAGCFSADGYTHDAQIVIYNGPDTRFTGHEIAFAYNEDSLTIVDVSDKSNMKMLSRQEYVDSFYCHQGWLTEDMTHLMMDDELDEQDGPTKKTRTMLWSVENLDAPTLVGSHYAEVDSIDHNLYIKGEHGYLANYCSGLRILSSTQIAKGAAPEEAFFDVAPYCDTTDFKGAWSTYPFFKSGSIVVSSIELGLFILKANLK